MRGTIHAEYENIFKSYIREGRNNPYIYDYLAYGISGISNQL